MNAKLLGLSLVLLSLAGTPASALVEVATLGNKHLADVQMELRNLLGNTNIDLQGFIGPTSFHYTPDMNHFFVLEKKGFLYRMETLVGNKAQATLVLDLSGKVFDFGDHGATSIWVDVRGTFLYMTYMLVDPQNPGIKNTCTDSGEMGRPDDQIKGCRTFGMMSRWPLDANGNIVGGEQVVLNGYQEVTVGAETTYLMCAQFSTHSMCSVVQDPITKTLYVSASDGAGFAGTDWGQFGGNPCHDRAAYGGAFRALDPARWTGKILKVNPDTLAVNIFSSGHRNAWRLFWDAPNNRLLESETGWFTYEEINVIEEGINYGWPCFEGPELSPHYNDPNDLGVPYHGNAACLQIQNSNTWRRPAFAYRKPENPPPGNVQSISAVAAVQGIVVYADLTKQIVDQLNGAFGNDETVTRGVGVVEFRVLADDTLVAVDFSNGHIYDQQIDGLEPLPTPSPLPPAYVRIVPGQVGWVAGSGVMLHFGAESNTEGREGLIYTWRVLFIDCAFFPFRCTTTTVVDNVISRTIDFAAPRTSGILELHVTAGSYGGFALPAPTLYIRNTDEIRPVSPSATATSSRARSNVPGVSPSSSGAPVTTPATTPSRTRAASLAPSNAAPVVGIVPGPQEFTDWLAGGIGQLGFLAVSTLAAVEDPVYTWDFSLLTCTTDPTQCTVHPIGFEQTANRATINVPSVAGTLRVGLRLSPFQYSTTNYDAAPLYMGARFSNGCVCTIQAMEQAGV